MTLKFLNAVLLTLALILSAFAPAVYSPAYSDDKMASTAGEAPTAVTADIVDVSGKKIGVVQAKQTKKGVEFTVNVSGLTPGMHGIHVHSVGKCETPDFKSAGGHFAMPDQHHGLENAKGPHMGDLPNLVVAKDGTAKTTFTDQSITLQPGNNSLMKSGGTALIIHADKDDQHSDPAGNAGGRIACAVLSE
jgi:superoxide dismutase, Cu-Zn family